MSIKSPLKNAKGHGPAKSGSHHWWMQRVTALMLIPLVVLFIVKVVSVIAGGAHISALYTSPVAAIVTILFLATALYHGSLGMQVIIEDYISCKLKKTCLLLLVQGASLVVGVSVVIAVLYAHIQ